MMRNKYNDIILCLDEITIYSQLIKDELIQYLLECMIYCPWHLKDDSFNKSFNYLVNTLRSLDECIRKKEKLALANYTKLNRRIISNLKKDIDIVLGIYDLLDDYLIAFTEYEVTRDFGDKKFTKDYNIHIEQLEQYITLDMKTLVKRSKKYRKNSKNSV